MAMGFPDLSEIKRALRLAKNDLNEAVAILTNEQPCYQGPVSSGGSSAIEDLASLDIDMKDPASSGSGEGKDGGVAGAGASSSSSSGTEQGFPVSNFYELEQRVFQASAITREEKKRKPSFNNSLLIKDVSSILFFWFHRIIGVFLISRRSRWENVWWPQPGWPKTVSWTPTITASNSTNGFCPRPSGSY